MWLREHIEKLQSHRRTPPSESIYAEQLLFLSWINISFGRLAGVPAGREGGGDIYIYKLTFWVSHSSAEKGFYSYFICYVGKTSTKNKEPPSPSPSTHPPHPSVYLVGRRLMRSRLDLAATFSSHRENNKAECETMCNLNVRQIKSDRDWTVMICNRWVKFKTALKFKFSTSWALYALQEGLILNTCLEEFEKLKGAEGEIKLPLVVRKCITKNVQSDTCVLMSH